jgi:hypothetical protein
MMSLIHILNNYHDPFPQLTGRGGLHFHPSRQIVGGMLRIEDNKKSIKDDVIDLAIDVLSHQSQPKNITDTSEDEELKKKLGEVEENIKMQVEDKDALPSPYLTLSEIKKIKKSEYNKLNKPELKMLCDKLKIDSNGTKPELISRITNRIEESQKKSPSELYEENIKGEKEIKEVEEGIDDELSVKEMKFIENKQLHTLEFRRRLVDLLKQYSTYVTAINRLLELFDPKKNPTTEAIEGIKKQIEGSKKHIPLIKKALKASIGKRQEFIKNNIEKSGEMAIKILKILVFKAKKLIEIAQEVLKVKEPNTEELTRQSKKILELFTDVAIDVIKGKKETKEKGKDEMQKKLKKRQEEKTEAEPEIQKEQEEQEKKVKIKKSQLATADLESELLQQQFEEQELKKKQEEGQLLSKFQHLKGEEPEKLYDKAIAYYNGHGTLGHYKGVMEKYLDTLKEKPETEYIEPVEYYELGSIYAGKKKPTKKELEAEEAEFKRLRELAKIEEAGSSPAQFAHDIKVWCDQRRLNDNTGRVNGDGKALEVYFTKNEFGIKTLKYVAQENSEIKNVDVKGTTNIPDCITKYGQLRDSCVFDLFNESCIFEIKYRAKNGDGYFSINYNDPKLKYIPLTATKIEGNDWFTPIWKKDPKGNFKIINVNCEYKPPIESPESPKVDCLVYKNNNFRDLYAIFLLEDGLYKYDISNDVTDDESEYKRGLKNILVKKVSEKTFTFLRTRYNRGKNYENKNEYQIPKSKFIKI